MINITTMKTANHEILSHNELKSSQSQLSTHSFNCVQFQLK